MQNIEGKVTCIIHLLEGLHPYIYPVMFQIMQIPGLVTKLGQLIFMEHTGTLIMQLFKYLSNLFQMNKSSHREGGLYLSR